MFKSEQDGRMEINKPILKYIRGIPVPNTEQTTSENVTSTLDYKPLDGDILLCSYPKTGSTWMQYIIWQVLHKGASYPQMRDMVFGLVPFMGICGSAALENLKHPRFYRNHFQYSMMKINEKAKYVYIYRNPEDTLASLYHFQNALSGIHSNFNEFYENFLSGEVYFGDYFDHVLSYYSRRHSQNMFLVSYEEMHNDTRGQVLRLAKFLGYDYYRALLDDDCLLDKILQTVSFDYMKQNLKFVVKKEDGDERIVPFYRKGIVGDGKNLLSQEQMERLHSKMSETMKQTELIDYWANLKFSS